MLNGDGLRVVLWVAGCTHGCKECQNPVTWDPNGGLFCLMNAQKKSCLSSWKKVISAESHTAEEIRCMWGTERRLPHLQKRSVKSSRKRHRWLYTGYEWNQIQNEAIIPYLDVVVDGRFEVEQKDTKLHWKGSANQKVIDVQGQSENRKKLCCNDA